MIASTIARVFPIALIFALAVTSACESEATRFPVIVTVISDDGKPFAGVPITIGKAAAGTTDAKGRLKVPVVGREGTKLSVSTPTPPGYRPANANGALVLRRLNDIESGDGKMLPIEHTITFVPIERPYSVLVRVGVPGLPVETFGTERATTNASGVAMFLYRGAPGDELKVRIDTSKRPDLRPQNPTATFVLAPHAEAYVVKENFTLVVKKKQPIRRITRIRRL